MSEQVAEQTPQRGTPEYNAMMVERYENQGGKPPAAEPTPAKPEKPANVPDKFWDAEKGQVNVEAWSKSYAELEKKFSQTGQKPAETPPEKPGEAPKEGEEDTAKKAVEAAGLDWDNLQETVNTTGKIPEESIEALEKIGIPRTIIEGYQEAITIAVEAARTNTYAYVGKGDPEVGKAQLDAALTWAAHNLSEPEREFYNQQLKSSSWKIAVDQIVARAGGQRPTSGEPRQLIGGEPAGSSGGYVSQAEMVKAMRDPRYRTDEAYRNSVRSKVAISNF